MIGVTQLLSGSLKSNFGTQSNPFTSYADVASSGLPNGMYFFNDGTRTREMYLDIDGTENGTGTGGWARWDDSIDANYYSGSECILADTGIASDGTISVRSSNYPTGIYSSQGNTSTNHGGCGIGSSSTYVKASKLAFSDPVFTNAASYYKNSRFYVYKSPETLRSDWYGNQSGHSGSYYAGTSAFPTSNTQDHRLIYMLLNVNSPSSSHAPPSTYNSTTFNDGTYKIVEGYEYPLGGTYDILIHFGQINYNGNGYKHSFKMWFKY